MTKIELVVLIKILDIVVNLLLETRMGLSQS